MSKISFRWKKIRIGWRQWLRVLNVLFSWLVKNFNARKTRLLLIFHILYITTHHVQVLAQHRQYYLSRFTIVQITVCSVLHPV